MKRFTGYLLVETIIETMLFGIVCYFLIKWDQPICNGWINTTYNTIGFILLIFPIINAIIVYISFSIFTNKYPRNNSTEFSFNPQLSQLGYQGNGKYVIEMKEIEKGIWITADDQENLKFDMRGYVFPKLYICTYFIRNFHYAVINKNKYPLIKLFKSMDLSPYTKYQNVEICFSFRGKIYNRKIVDDNKTKTTWLMRLMLRSKYYKAFVFGLSVGEMKKSYTKISEERYNNGEWS